MSGTRSRTVVDASWLGTGGVGSITRSLIDGLAEIHATNVVLRCPTPVSVVDNLPGISVEKVRRVRLMGQSAMPHRRGDRVIYLHQERPALSRATVQVFHDLVRLDHDPTWKKPFLAGVFAEVVRTSNVLVTSSEWVANRLRERYDLDENRIRVVHWPVRPLPTPQISGVSPHFEQPEKRTLLCLTRTDTHKNTRRLIDAWKRTNLSREGFKLEIVLGGYGPSRPDPGRILAPADGLTVHSYLTSAQLREVVARTAIAVVPSLDEGFGLPLIEATLAGIPTIASAIPTLQEVAGLPSGYEFDPTNVADMARAMTTAATEFVNGQARLATVLYETVSNRDMAEIFLDLCGHKD